MIGSRFVTVDALEAFKQVDELIPGPAIVPWARSGLGVAAWPSASASATYDEQSFVVKSNGQSGFLDHET